jgi:phage internal scaffolding protein
MSHKYYSTYGNKKITKNQMRKFLQHHGKKDDEGNILYFTEQSYKDECDVNNIIRKYDKTGRLEHVNKMEYKYGDVTGADFKKAADLVAGARSSFEDLPSDVRKKFKNDPGRFLEFFEDPKNRDEAIKLGLIDKNWTEETDGLGEHIKTEKDRKKKGKENGDDNPPATE